LHRSPTQASPRITRSRSFCRSSAPVRPWWCWAWGVWAILASRF
jgi:hypothetical protein